MTVRPAVPGDAPAIAAIWNPVIRDTSATFTTAEKTVPELVARIADAPAFLVAEDDGAVRGFIVMGQFRGGPGYARTMELTVYLDPAARGRGLGADLVAALEATAREQGVGSLWAGVGGENPRSVTFHERLGYEVVATLPKVGFKFGRWMDLVLLRKWLSADG